MVWSFEEFNHPRFFGDSWMWWREFLEGKADKTRRNYIKDLREFMEFHDYTTEKLFEEHRDNSRHEDPRRKKILGSKLYKYQTTLIAAGKSTGTAGNVEKSLRSFFRANELDFGMNGAAIKVTTEELPTIQKDELRLLLDVCGSIRLKTAIHVLKEGGMRVSDLCNMKVADIAEALEGESGFFTWTLTQIKTGRKADPVIGPEAIKWLKLWMQKRETDGIQSEWLFCTIEKRGDNRGVGEKVSPGTIGHLFRHYRDKAGLRETGVGIHSLRKQHKTLLEYSGVPTSWIDKMQGRVGRGSGGVYTKPSSEQLIQMFKKGYDELAIETHVSNDERYESLRVEIEILKVYMMENVFPTAYATGMSKEDFERFKENYKKHDLKR